MFSQPYIPLLRYRGNRSDMPPPQSFIRLNYLRVEQIAEERSAKRRTKVRYMSTKPFALPWHFEWEKKMESRQNLTAGYYCINWCCISALRLCT